MPISLKGLLIGVVIALLIITTPLQSASQATTATARLQLPVPQFSLVANLPRFGEGVVFDRQGRLFVSDPFANAVLLVSAAGEVQEWAQLSMPNGHKVLANGTHVVLERSEQGGAIAYLDQSGQVVRRTNMDEQGRLFRVPNDLTPNREGNGFYFTDPGAFMSGESGRVYYVSDQGEVCTVSDGEIDFPNGIILRPDDQILLISESRQNRVLEFRVQTPCPIERLRVFATLPSQPNPWTNGEAEPDGLALDESGNLYVAHFGAGLVRVFDPSGRLLGSWGSGSTSITNFAFGGAEMNELYLYAATGNSIEEIDRGGKIVRLVLPGVRGLRLIPP